MARRPFYQRPARVKREAPRAERDRLVQAHVAADDGGLADHDAGPVVDEEAGADLRGRVDVDPGQGVGDVGAQPRQEGHAEAVQAVRDAVVEHRDRAGIAQHDFGHRTGGRIAGQRRLHVGHDQGAHLGQAGGELARDAARPRGQLRLGDVLPLGIEAQRAPHLFDQPVERDVQGVADKIIDALVVQVGAAVVGREQRRAHALDHLAQHLARRQLAHASLVADVVGRFARGAQRIDDGAEMPMAGAGRLSVVVVHLIRLLQDGPKTNDLNHTTLYAALVPALPPLTAPRGKNRWSVPEQHFLLVEKPAAARQHGASNQGA